MYQLVLFQNQLSSQMILNRLQTTQKNQAMKSMTYLRSTDNFTIICSSTVETDLVKEQMMNFFEITDLGDISWLLGINITQDLA